MNLLSILVVSYAYISISVFAVGSLVVILRWIFKRKGPTGTYLGYPYLFTYPGQDTGFKALKNMLSRVFLFSNAKNDPFIRYTSLTFHWSLWIVILAHLDLVLSPYLVSVGISEGTLENLGAYLGTSLAMVMVVAGFVLFYRRISDPYMRRISYASDYFSILLIVAIGISGIVMRFVLPPGFSYSSVSPFVFSLGGFAPINLPSSPQFVIHFVLTLTLFLYLPLSKLAHPYSFFTSPTIYTISHEGESK